MMKKKKTPPRVLRKKNKKQFLILGGILTGLIIFISWCALNLPYFYLKDIQIKGLRRLSSLEILQKIPASPHTSIFNLNLKQISRKILSEPMVKKVTVKRRLPSTLVIEIEERSPFACVGKEESFWEVDREGVVLQKAEDMAGLTLIKGIDPFNEKELLLKALKALKFSRTINLEIKKIVIEKGARGILLQLQGGVEVILGTSPNYRYLSYLPYIFEDARKRGERFNLIDLRFANQIIASF